MAEETFGVGVISGNYPAWKQARDVLLQCTLGPFVLVGCIAYAGGLVVARKIGVAKSKPLRLES